MIFKRFNSSLIPHPLSLNSGYTLIEILVAFAVLALGLIFVVNMWGVLVKGTQKLGGHVDAVYLAEDLMEEIMEGAYFNTSADETLGILRVPKKFDEAYDPDDRRLRDALDDLTEPANLGTDAFGTGNEITNWPARWRFDDIDDYRVLRGDNEDGADGRGPRDINGNLLMAKRVGNSTIGFAGFRRAVDVFYANEIEALNNTHYERDDANRRNFKMVTITVFWQEEGEEKQYILSKVKPNTPPSLW